MYPERILKALQRANARIMAGTPAEALDDLQKVLEKMPKAFDGWFLLGQANMNLGDAAGAERCFRKATQLQPRSVESWANLGMACSARNMYPEALAAYLRSVSMGAAQPGIIENIGICYLQMDRYEEAISAFRDLLWQRDTDNTWLLLGMSYQGADRYPEALDAYLKAEEKGGHDYTLFLNIGSCYSHLDDPDKAAEYARKALALKPDDDVAWWNLGTALGPINFAESLAALSRSRLPGARGARASAMLYMDPPDPIRLRREHEAAVADALAAAASGPAPMVLLPEGEKMRVGFVSHDFREHPVGFFFEGLLRHLDRDRFAIYCYSDVRKEDAVTARMRGLGDHWRDIFGKGNGAFQQMVEEDRLHVLIDLGGHTNADRLLAFARPMAPVQATYLGYSCTTGLATMDYLLGDAVITPEGTEHQYTEKLFRLGPVFATYTPPPMELPVSAAPMLAKGHPTFGSFCRLNKVSASTIRLWIDAMGAVPDARFLMMAKGFANDAVRRRFLASFIEAGIDPERFDLRPHGTLEEFFAAHHEIDLILDSTPWNGHTTTLHALWMGVPTLTVKGSSQAGRFGEMVLNAAGLPSFVLESSSGFGQAAARLLATSECFKGERKWLREALLASPLCDHAGLARRFENACASMYRTRMGD